MARPAMLWCAAAALLAVAAATAAADESKVLLEREKAGAEIIWDSWGVPHIYADNYDVLVRFPAPH